MHATINTDGAARGNPGPSAFAYVIARDGQPPLEAKGCLGTATNNQAEYEALVRALEHATRLGVRSAVVQSDSELLVRQMNGEYRVKDPTLRDLYEQASALRRQFDSLTLRHVRREANRRADELCNEALDGPSPVRRARPDRPADPDEAAVDCLRDAQVAWSRGETTPTAEDLWQSLKALTSRRRPVRRQRPDRKSL